MERQVRVIRTLCTGCNGVERRFEFAEVFFNEDGTPDSKYPVCLKGENLYELRQVATSLNEALFRPLLEADQFPRQEA